MRDFYGPQNGFAIVNVTFLLAVHLLGILSLGVLGVFKWQSFALGFLWWWLSNTAVGAGYHRYYAHGSHKARWPLECFYLLFGAGSFQGPATRWSALHNWHHAHSDGPMDPYSVSYARGWRGFLWAHMGWVIWNLPAGMEKKLRSFERNRLMKIQRILYLPLGVSVGFLLPAFIGSMWADALGAFFIAGPLRLVIQYHQTFLVNSLAHWFGERVGEGSARNGGWLVALLTHGEGGNHGDHHLRPRRLSIGPGWWDPPRWWVLLARKLRLAYDIV